MRRQIRRDGDIQKGMELYKNEQMNMEVNKT